jgi:hypothetical protein
MFSHKNDSDGQFRLEETGKQAGMYHENFGDASRL